MGRPGPGRRVESFQSEAAARHADSLKAGGTAEPDRAITCFSAIRGGIPRSKIRRGSRSSHRPRASGHDLPLVAADTVEERILELQQRKRAIGEARWRCAAAAGLRVKTYLLFWPDQR